MSEFEPVVGEDAVVYEDQFGRLVRQRLVRPEPVEEEESK